MIILAKEYVETLEEALPFLEAGKRCLFGFLDEDWNQNYADLTMENYDSLAAESWDKGKHNAGYCIVFCDCLVYDEGKPIARLEPGSYVFDIGEVVTKYEGKNRIRK